MTGTYFGGERLPPVDSAWPVYRLDIGMIFGDEAWVTWVLRDDDLVGARFEHARASLFVG